MPAWAWVRSIELLAWIYALPAVQGKGGRELHGAEAHGVEQVDLVLPELPALEGRAMKIDPNEITEVFKELQCIQCKGVGYEPSGMKLVGMGAGEIPKVEVTFKPCRFNCSPNLDLLKETLMEEFEENDSDSLY
jgi:hypothetical protein